MLSISGGSSSVVSGGGQSLEDKLYAVKYFISGLSMSFVVRKATTSELLGPKKKHLDYLVKLTNEPNVSIPHLAKNLMERALHSDWAVAFKALITIHHLMSYGNERFSQNLASSTVNHRWFNQLSNNNYRSSALAYDMSKFVRRYSRYINERIQSYKSQGTDFCRIAKNTVSGEPHVDSPQRMKTFTHSQLMTLLPILQSQFDSLLAFDATAHDLNNGVINSAFSNLFKDFVKLYIAYQAAVIRLLELYFTVTQLKRAQELFDHYKKFLVRMDKVSDFMRVIDQVGLDKSDVPDVIKSPNFSFKLLEQRLRLLESQSNERDKLVTTASVELPKINDSFTVCTNPRRQKSFKGDSRRHSLTNITPEVSQFKTPQTRRRSRNMQIGPSKTIEESVEELLRCQYEDKKNNNIPSPKTVFTSPGQKSTEPTTYLGDLLLPEPVIYAYEGNQGKKEEQESDKLSISTASRGTPSPVQTVQKKAEPNGQPADWVRVEL